MKPFLTGIWLWLCCGLTTFAQPSVPKVMDYAGITLKLDAGARTKVAAIIGRLTKSPFWFDKLADKSALYMPYVDLAFQEAGVPEDLKYIVIMESGMRSDVVSSSNAVGFWQFKKFTATKMGLQVDKQIDERKHIIRASEGAAAYFKYINDKFDNWLYAVIGYNQGEAGALDHIEAKYYGVKTLPVTGKTHPYALKAIAYKLAFQHELDHDRGLSGALLAYPVKGGTSVSALAKSFEVDKGDLQQYNTWIRTSKLPAGKEYYVFVYRKGEKMPVLADGEGWGKGLAGGDIKGQDDGQDGNGGVYPGDAGGTSAAGASASRFRNLSLAEDKDFGRRYFTFATLKRYHKLVRKHSRKKLKYWEGRKGKSGNKKDWLHYLKPPRKRKYHVVDQGENLLAISRLYRIPIEVLQVRNRMEPDNHTIYDGQKLYLRRKKPKREPILIMKLPVSKSGGKGNHSGKGGTKVKNGTSNTSSGTKIKAGNSSGGKEQVKRDKGTYHTVQAGDTLWSISRKYNTSVESIRKLNDLSDNTIKIGQRIKVSK